MPYSSQVIRFPSPIENAGEKAYLVGPASILSSPSSSTELYIWVSHSVPLCFQSRTAPPQRVIIHALLRLGAHLGARDRELIQPRRRRVPSKRRVTLILSSKSVLPAICYAEVTATSRQRCRGRLLYDSQLLRLAPALMSQAAPRSCRLHRCHTGPPKAEASISGGGRERHLTPAMLSHLLHRKQGIKASNESALYRESAMKERN